MVVGFSRIKGIWKRRDRVGEGEVGFVVIRCV